MADLINIYSVLSFICLSKMQKKYVDHEVVDINQKSVYQLYF